MCTSSADVAGTGCLCILIDLKYSRAGDGMGFYGYWFCFSSLGCHRAFQIRLDQYKPWSESLVSKAQGWCPGQRKRAGCVLWDADIQEHPCSSAPWSWGVEFSGRNSLGAAVGLWGCLVDVASVGCAGTACSAHQGQSAAWSASLPFAKGGDLVS